MENKICTSVDQSKKLIELGIDVDTADLTVIDLPIQNGDRFKFIQNKLPSDIFPSITDGKSEKIPAWSLSALLDILPLEIELHKQFDGNIKYYYMEYTTKKTYFASKRYTNPVDTAFEMVVWLKK